MDNEKDLLIASAARLYSMGIDLEAVRDRLRQLVEQGVPYHSDEMKQAAGSAPAIGRARRSLSLR